MVILCRK